MKYITLLALLTKLALSASSMPCPSGNFSQYTAATSCTDGDLTFSNFSFSSTASGGGTAYTASDFYSQGFQIDYLGNYYLGLQFVGPVSEPAGATATATFNFDVTVTDGSNALDGIALAMTSSATAPGYVTLNQSGVAGGKTYDTQVTNLKNVSQALFNSPQNAVDSSTLLTVNGPAQVSSFQIKVDEGAVPEPGTWAMLGAGLGVVAVMRFRGRSV